MKIILLLSIIIFSLTSYGQPGKKDTLKKDTVYVPLYQVRDTIPSQVVYKKGKGDRLYQCDGFMVVLGYKKYVNGQFVWEGNPEFLEALDSRKKKISKPVNATQQ